MDLHRDVRVFGGNGNNATTKINYKMELLNEKEFVTKYGDINTKTWDGIKVYRGRQRNADSFHITVTIQATEEFEVQIANGYYSIRSNWANIDITHILFDDLEFLSTPRSSSEMMISKTYRIPTANDPNTYKYEELEQLLNVAIENRDLYIDS